MLTSNRCGFLKPLETFGYANFRLPWPMLDWFWGVGGVGGGLLSSKDVLVRELCVLGEGLRKRDADLDEHARRLEGTVKDLKAEQDRQESRKCHP